ncbi:MAG: VWA domain-containing protein [Deltaproteobacteria bacterium]|nr:MAG: VWA domain-containing protein [Deltaproteobacteria bacterium]
MHRSLPLLFVLAACGTTADPALDAPDVAIRKTEPAPEPVELEEVPDRFVRITAEPDLVIGEGTPERAGPPAGAVLERAPAKEAAGGEVAAKSELAELLGSKGTLDSGLSDGIGGLIGAKGSSMGSGGLGIRGSGLAGGGAVGYGSGGGSFGGSVSSEIGTVGRGGGGSAYIASGSGSSYVAPAPQPTRPLRAGSTDDNAAFDAYLAYLDKERSHGRLGRVDPVDVSSRVLLRVLDASGEPVPSATVTLLNDGEEVWTGETYGDGRLPYYPAQLGAEITRVRVSHDGKKTEARWTGDEEFTVTLDVKPDARVRMDVALVLDTTGSMADELAAIKQSVLHLTERLRAEDRSVDLRFAAVLYRDQGDRYVTEKHAFTDIASFDRMLESAEADGGGDTPEAMHEALEVAVHELDWREDAARVAFLVADAPPQLRGRPHGQTSLDALSEGIRIHTVAASGLDGMGSLVMRRVAQLTRGKFIFIEYGGDLSGSAAAHGVTGQVESNNLDAILFRELKAEMDGWGVWTL